MQFLDEYYQITHQYNFDPAVHFDLRNQKIKDYTKFNCKINMTVKSTVDNVGDEIYEIDFECVYVGLTEKEVILAKQLHPMYNDKDFMENNYYGDVLPINEITKPIIKYLLTPINYLKNVPKKISNYDFHCDLLKTLSIHSI